MGKIACLLCCALVWLASPLSAGAETLVDVFGREVQVPDKVERLVALGSSMCFVTYLGAQHLAVGVEDIEKIFITKPYVIVNQELVKDVPVIGKAGPVRIPNYEEIIRLKPDVIFIVSVERGEPDLIQRKTNIPVVAVGQGMPNFDEAVYLRSIELVGQVLDREEKAGQLVDYIRSLPQAFTCEPPEEAVATAYVGGLSYKGMHGIISTTADFFPMNLAGIRNVVDAVGSPGHLFVNEEYLLTTNPPLIFLDGNGLDLIRDGVDTDGEYYARLKALREGKAYTLLPNTSYFTNPEILYVNAFFMAKIAYPEAYAGLDPVAKADEIFEAFNGVPLYDVYVEHGYGFSHVVLEDGRLVLTPYVGDGER